MNKEYSQLLNYFQKKGAVSQDSAVRIDDLQIEGVSKEDLKSMLRMMGADFHETDDGRFWYEKTPVITKDQLLQMVAAFILILIVLVLFMKA